jgi:hypothetical protein
MTEQTESLQEQVVRPNYEQIVSGIKHAGVREILTHAKEDEQRLNTALAQIGENGDLTDEARERQAQELIERYGPKINAAYASAREKVGASVDSSYGFSIPMPDNKTLGSMHISDATELQTVQNATTALINRAEAARARATMEDRSKAGGNKGIRPARDPRVQLLKEAYSRAMAGDGVEAKVGALGVVRACEQMGLDIETVVGDHRTDVHYRALDDARRFENAYRVMPSGKRTPDNPFGQKRTGRRDVGTYQPKTGAITQDKSTLFAAKRSKHW